MTKIRSQISWFLSSSEFWQPWKVWIGLVLREAAMSCLEAITPWTGWGWRTLFDTRSKNAFFQRFFKPQDSPSCRSVIYMSKEKLFPLSVFLFITTTQKVSSVAETNYFLREPKERIASAAVYFKVLLWASACGSGVGWLRCGRGEKTLVPCEPKWAQLKKRDKKFSHKGCQISWQMEELKRTCLTLPILKVPSSGT